MSTPTLSPLVASTAASSPAFHVRMERLRLYPHRAQHGRIVLHGAHAGGLPLGLGHVRLPIPKPHAVGQRFASAPGRARRRFARAGRGGSTRRQCHIGLHNAPRCELRLQLRGKRWDGGKLRHGRGDRGRRRGRFWWGQRWCGAYSRACQGGGCSRRRCAAIRLSRAGGAMHWLRPVGYRMRRDSAGSGRRRRVACNRLTQNPSGQSGRRMRTRKTNPGRGRRCHMRSRCHRSGDGPCMAATSSMSCTRHQCKGQSRGYRHWPIHAEGIHASTVRFWQCPNAQRADDPKTVAHDLRFRRMSGWTQWDRLSNRQRTADRAAFN